MKRKISLTLAILMISAGLFAQHGTVRGLVTDKITGECIPFAGVQLLNNGKPSKMTLSGIDGHFTIKEIARGKYSLRVSEVGYQSEKIEELFVRYHRKNTINIQLSASTPHANEVEIISYKIPLIHKENTTYPITSDDIEKMPERSTMVVASRTRVPFYAISRVPREVYSVLFTVALLFH